MRNMMLPSGYVKIAIENDHLYWIYPLKMVIFYSYVSLPEGKIRNQWKQPYSEAIQVNIQPMVPWWFPSHIGCLGGQPGRPGIILK